MKKSLCASLIAAISLLSVVSFAGCNVDENYNLSNLDTGSLGLGTDETAFDIPLVTVSLNAADFFISDEANGAPSTKGVSLDFVTDHWDSGIMGLIYQINAILPSNLEGDYADGIDLVKFTEPEYVAGLVEAVVEEYATDDAKILDFCEMMLVRAPNYADEVAIIEEAFGINFYDVSLSAQDCAEILKSALNDEEKQHEFVELFQSQIMPGIMAVLVDFANITIEEEVAAIVVPDSVYEFIDGNLDGDKNYLQIGASITTNLPFKFSFDSSLVYQDSEAGERLLDITSSYDYSGEKGVIDNVDVLRSILEMVTIKADVSLDSYTPMSDMSLDGKYVTVTLMARKNGSVKF